MSRLTKKYQPFRFKQFTVDHNLSSMKVGVDAVLLGAWAKVEKARNILDVGTGSGLIALMMAQKNTEAEIHAIDIEENAFKQAEINFSNSAWKQRFSLYLDDFNTWQTNTKFDVIISNPPFFSQSLKSEIEGRNLARHNDALPLHNLLQKAKILLNDRGSLFMVYPAEALDEIKKEIKICALYLKSITLVKPIISKPPKRVLVEITNEVIIEVTQNELCIHSTPEEFTKEYVELTKDFYIIF